MTQNWTLIIESNWIFSKLYIYIDMEKHLYILKMVSDWQHGSN